jgi:hypothetical protein
MIFYLYTVRVMMSVVQTVHAWFDNTVHKLIAVKVLHVIAEYHCGRLPLGSYAPMPAPSPPFKTNLELVLWNGLQSCFRIIPDVISVIKMTSFMFGNRNKSLGARTGE